jgi:hypothetical protein
MLAANPKLSPSQVKSRIINAADQSAALAGTSVSAGELNTANALSGATGARYTGGGTGTVNDPPPWNGWRRRQLFSTVPISLEPSS